MFRLALLSLLALAFGADPPSPTYPPDHNGYLTIEQVTALIRSVEDDLKELQADISAAQTLCSVGWERIKIIRDKRLTALKLRDEQQHALVDVFKAEIKDLQHRTDDAQATVAESKQRAQDTANEIGNLANAINNEQNTNNVQMAQGSSLRMRVADMREAFLDNLNGSISNLTSDLMEVQDKVYTVHEFVESRKCEHGFFSLHLDEDNAYQRIDFKTVFDEPPSMTVNLAGFSAHLDIVRYSAEHEYDILGLDKYVGTTVDQAGFVAHAIDVSSGQVDLKTVYCSYMACQNIDEKVDLPEQV